MTLRRTGPITRKTSLRSHTPLTASSPLSRSTPLSRRSALRARSVSSVGGDGGRPERAKPTRPKVSPEERTARRIVASRSHGRCEGCWREPATDWAHRKARSQGGPWAASNGMHLGRTCHSWAHANPRKARDLGWILRSTDDPLTVPAFLAWRGWHLLADDGEITAAERTALS